MYVPFAWSSSHWYLQRWKVLPKLKFTSFYFVLRISYTICWHNINVYDEVCFNAQSNLRHFKLTVIMDFSLIVLSILFIDRCENTTKWFLVGLSFLFSNFYNKWEEKNRPERKRKKSFDMNENVHTYNITARHSSHINFGYSIKLMQTPLFVVLFLSKSQWSFALYNWCNWINFTCKNQKKQN